MKVYFKILLKLVKLKNCPIRVLYKNNFFLRGTVTEQMQITDFNEGYSFCLII